MPTLTVEKLVRIHCIFEQLFEGQLASAHVQEELIVRFAACYVHGRIVYRSQFVRTVYVFCFTSGDHVIQILKQELGGTFLSTRLSLLQAGAEMSTHRGTIVNGWERGVAGRYGIAIVVD